MDTNQFIPRLLADVDFLFFSVDEGAEEFEESARCSAMLVMRRLFRQHGRQDMQQQNDVDARRRHDQFLFVIDKAAATLWAEMT